MRRSPLLIASLLALATAVPTALAAQGAIDVLVRDDAGQPVPYAVVRLKGGVQRIADDSGYVQLALAAKDSAELQVRRIGYKEFFGKVGRAADGRFVVTLPVVARTVGAVTVTAAANTPLARTGFYDRVERVKKGAFSAEMVPPEELEFRNAMQVSRLLDGRRSVRVARNRNGQPVILGRGGCGMTIIVDGQRVSGTVEENVVGEAPSSINPAGTRQGGGGGGMTIDQVVNGTDVMAIEIYPSTANAPAELIQIGGRGSCGMVVIWTGARQ